MNFEQTILRALVAENRPEAMVNAVKIAPVEMSYEKVFEAIMEMENKNYLKLVYCQQPTIINVQLTQVGSAALKKE